MRILGCIMLAALCGACVTAEAVRFQPRAQQEAIVRDGRNALVSRRANSLVLVRPAKRKITADQRPVFVVGIYNKSSRPIDFRVSSVSVVQTVDGSPPIGLRVIPYEKLVHEERGRQIAAAILTGVAAGANAAIASNAGHGTYTSTTHGPLGTYTTTGTFYDSSAAAAAQTRAAARNDAMVGRTIETGRRNLATLERSVIKDNTLLPGEWYGGQLHIQSPMADESGGPKRYSLALMIGADRHEIDIVQAPIH